MNNNRHGVNCDSRIAVSVDSLSTYTGEHNAAFRKPAAPHNAKPPKSPTPRAEPQILRIQRPRRGADLIKQTLANLPKRVRLVTNQGPNESGGRGEPNYTNLSRIAKVRSIGY
jgi:hypothetical protein